MKMREKEESYEERKGKRKKRLREREREWGLKQRKREKKKNVYEKCRNKKVCTYIALILSFLGLNALHYYICITKCLSYNLWTVNENSIGDPKMWNNQNTQFSNIANFLIGPKQLCCILGPK